MGKRALEDGENEMDAKAQFGGRRVNIDDEDIEMGEFEDPWEDELEEDEEVIDGEASLDDNDEDEGVLCCSYNCADLQKWKASSSNRKLISLDNLWTRTRF